VYYPSIEIGDAKKTIASGSVSERLSDGNIAVVLKMNYNRYYRNTYSWYSITSATATPYRAGENGAPGMKLTMKYMGQYIKTPSTTAPIYAFIAFTKTTNFSTYSFGTTYYASLPNNYYFCANNQGGIFNMMLQCSINWKHGTKTYSSSFMLEIL
jgi:hypothetical protein